MKKKLMKNLRGIVMGIMLWDEEENEKKVKEDYRKPRRKINLNYQDIKDLEDAATIRQADKILTESLYKKHKKKGGA